MGCAILATAWALGALLADAPQPSPTPTPTPTPSASPGPQSSPAPSPAASGQVRGSVSYGRHQPAVGAIVVVVPEGGGSPIRLATTGTNGTFAFNGLADGIYRADVEREGYSPVTKTGIQVRAPFRAVVEVLLVKGAPAREAAKAVDGSASLGGIIRVAGGAPLAEARVRLTRSDGADDSKTILTNGSGAFYVPRMKAGRWHLDVQGAGLLPMRADLDVVGDVAIDAQLAAQPANYHPLPQDLIVPEEVIPPAGS